MMARVRLFPVMTVMLARPSRALSTSSIHAGSATSLLKNPSLLPSVDPDSDECFAVYNPANPQEVVAYCPSMSMEQIKSAIEESSDVLSSWRDGTTAAKRADLLRAWSSLLLENTDDLATIMTLEAGKPLAESKGEVTYGRSFLDYFAGEAIRPTSAGGGFITPTPFADEQGGPRGQVLAIQQAVGVTALLTPWNFPLAMITRKVGPALAAGCTALVKPASLTPLTALAAHRLAMQAGIPPQVLQLVMAGTDATPEVGKELTTNPLIRKISFTGSVKVGKLLMEQSSSTMKRLSLELGGNAPFVVFADADIEQAAEAAVKSKFRNAGQTCVCSDRFLVHRSVHDDFVARFAAKVRDLTIGPGIDPSTTCGPLISTSAVDVIADKVQEALEKNAKVVVGGQRLADLGPNFYAPTILTQVDPSSRIWKDETFGPVAAVVAFDDESEALALANAPREGLAAYFCTSDASRAFRFAKALECGLVGVNEGIISTAVAPFGGVKDSGLGREGSALGIGEYLETKYMYLNF